MHSRAACRLAMAIYERMQATAQSIMISIPRGKHLASALIVIVAVFIAVLLLQPGIMAQGPKPPSTPAKALKEVPAEVKQPSVAHTMTAADVEAFLEGVLPLQLAREDIAGATVAVVKDGKLLFARGYGHADVAKKRPVSAETTLFRPGSVSKLFTWTAVMQQVEQGKLNLDRDVNDYIDFKIPPMDGKPITLRNIMTHTPGFEETIQELFVRDEKSLSPLDVYLKAHLPARIYAPGTTPAYCNYATALAGYMVQRVSGEPFFDYVDNHILKPLGMNYATFRQPLPDNLKPFMSKGYEVASQPAKEFEWVEAAPAGSSSASATDMARFMIAHLQDGELDGVRILRPETAKLMHSSQFTSVPGMNAMALGFYEETRNGHRIIGHAGDTEYFHSDLHLVPDAGVGFFISYNSAGKGEISPRNAVWESFLDRYFPVSGSTPPAIATAAQDAKMLAGRYIVSRRHETSFMRLLTALGQAKVYANGDGTISVDALKDLSGKPKKFAEIAPLMFKEVNGQDRLAFKRDNGGILMAIDFPFMVYHKAAWYESSALQIPLLVFSLVIFALTLIIWPVSALVRWHYGRKLEVAAPKRTLRLLVRIACVLNIVFVLAFVLFFYLGLKDIGLFSPRYNYVLHLIQIVGWIGVIGTLVAIYNMVVSWKMRDGWLWTKVGDTVIALACVGFVWFLFTWNALHWTMRY